MKTVSKYQTTDYQLFSNEKEALNHQLDLVGESLDDLLPHDDRGNVTYCDRYNLLMKQLKDPDLYRKVNKLMIHLKGLQSCNREDVEFTLSKY